MSSAFFLWLGVSFLAMTGGHGRVSDSPPNTFSAKDTGCPAEFQGRCRCGLVPYGPEGIIQYITNCTDTGFQDVHMLKSLPVETQVLLFTGNEVYDLPVNLFGQVAQYPHMHTIDLSDNHIQGIRGRTFHTVSTVRTLILNNNDIYVVSKDHHPRMFSNFEQLEELYLRNAFTDKKSGSLYISNVAATFQESELLQLRKLDLSENSLDGFQDSRDIFCSLPELEELDLSDNRLTGLDDLNLGCLEHLRKLDISSNHMTTLTNATLTNLDRIKNVNVSQNPFVCDCLLHDTVAWLRKTGTQVADRDRLLCVVQEEGPGPALVSLRESELPCRHSSKLEQQHTLHGHLRASYIVLALVVLVFSLLLAAVLYRNRLLVSGLVSSCVAPITNKLRYSSLDKREEAEMEV